MPRPMPGPSSCAAGAVKWPMSPGTTLVLSVTLLLLGIPSAWCCYSGNMVRRFRHRTRRPSRYRAIHFVSGKKQSHCRWKQSRPVSQHDQAPLTGRSLKARDARSARRWTDGFFIVRRGPSLNQGVRVMFRNSKRMGRWIVIAVTIGLFCCLEANAKNRPPPHEPGNNGGGVIYFSYDGDMYTMNDDGSSILP